MQRADPLAPITPDEPNGKASQHLILNTLNNDDTAYDKLAVKHNKLIDHVEKFCQ